MRIAIPDDYQNVLYSLCHATLASHEVVRYREPAADVSDFMHKLHVAGTIVPVRKHNRFQRELIERLPHLCVISQTGRSTRHIDGDACEISMRVLRKR